MTKEQISELSRATGYSEATVTFAAENMNDDVRCAKIVRYASAYKMTEDRLRAVFGVIGTKTAYIPPIKVALPGVVFRFEKAPAPLQTSGRHSFAKFLSAKFKRKQR